MKADLGLIGLAVMGQNLAYNLLDNGYKIAVYNRSEDKINETINNYDSENLIPSYSIKELINSLATPKIILLLIKSGPPVDHVIDELYPLLSDNDIIIDGGNSNFQDTIIRYNRLKEKGIHFVGMGISGGETGARYGPSIMPGGSPEAWKIIKGMFQSIAAKTDDGSVCCKWIGSDGAGHYVKMVHNGIEYGDMELIAETFDIMKKGLQLEISEIANIFVKWNKGKLNSYLIEITSKILQKKDTETDDHLVERILDTASQKGTGKWTALSALDLGIPLTLITTAVYQRFLSSLKTERKLASKLLEYETSPPKDIDKEQLLMDLENALYLSKIISYSQGFSLLRTASKNYKWKLDLGEIALIWRKGCIIRSIFLDDIFQTFEDNPDIQNLLFGKFFKKEVSNNENSLRNIVNFSIQNKIPIPGFSSALAFLDGYRSEYLPANLIQAQRDYFGAHGYERIDKESTEKYHTDWDE